MTRLLITLFLWLAVNLQAQETNIQVIVTITTTTNVVAEWKPDAESLEVFRLLQAVKRHDYAIDGQAVSKAVATNTFTQRYILVPVANTNADTRAFPPTPFPRILKSTRTAAPPLPGGTP